jgi:predicted  nucleic acid-binding Zn-ribbon protein
MADIKEIKEKFNLLQNKVTQLSNQKIGLESEIKTVESDMQELEDKIIKASGKSTLDEALKFFTEQSTVLDEKKAKLSAELDKYLSIDGVTENISLD